MAATFPPKEAYDIDRMSVAFPADVGDQRIVCMISVEALEDHFGLPNANPDDAVRAFKASRPRIEEKAAQMIDTGRLEGDGKVLLRSTDF
jgi:hypothetical protein